MENTDNNVTTEVTEQGTQKGAENKGTENKDAENKGTENKGTNGQDESHNNDDKKKDETEQLFEKLDGIISKRLDGLTKSILRDNGINDDDEIKALISDYKNSKNSKLEVKENTLKQIQKENEELKAKIRGGELSKVALKVSKDLDINEKYIPQIMKLADLSEVVKDDNTIQSEKLNEAFKKVIEDCDAFKNKADTNQSYGFKNIGADKDGKDSETSTVSKLRSAMGLK